MKNNLIVFDLDGTLLNTIEDLNAATNYALDNNGYNVVTIDETRKFIGNGIKKLIERSLKGNLEKFDIVFADFKNYYFENIDVYTKPYDGINELLFKLKNKGYKLAVLSNKEHNALNKLCDSHFEGIFSMVIGDRPDIDKKPSTMGLSYICEHLNEDIKNVLYIGDSEVDVKTVLNSECNGIFVSYGFRDKEDLLNAGAKIICDSVYELMEKLEV